MLTDRLYQVAACARQGPSPVLIALCTFPCNLVNQDLSARWLSVNIFCSREQMHVVVSLVIFLLLGAVVLDEFLTNRSCQRGISTQVLSVPLDVPNVVLWCSHIADLLFDGCSMTFTNGRSTHALLVSAQPGIAAVHCACEPDLYLA